MSPGFFDIIFGSNKPKSPPKKVKKIEKKESSKSLKQENLWLLNEVKRLSAEPETDESEPEIEIDEPDA